MRFVVRVSFSKNGTFYWWERFDNFIRIMVCIFSEEISRIGILRVLLHNYRVSIIMFLKINCKKNILKIRPELPLEMRL